MWPYETRRETRAYLTHLLRRLLFRTIILIAVCIMALKVSPRIQGITQAKLIGDFKRPRRHSYFPIWVMIFLIVITPLVIFWILTKDIRETIEIILSWSLSISITALITEIVKLVVGRPRPDFFYRCFPDGIMANIEELQCAGTFRDVMEGRKSFPSGHTSLSFASLGVLSLFIYERRRMLSDGQGRVSQVICYLLPLALAAVIGASRWFDNHHHWDDVLVGAFIGLTTSYMSYSVDDSSVCGILLYRPEGNSTASSTLIGDRQEQANTTQERNVSVLAKL